MTVYKAPTQEIQFVLKELLDVESHFAQMPKYAEVNAELIDQVVEEAGKFVEGVFHPSYHSSDTEGCQYNAEDKSVTTPKGYQEAYKQFVENGWPAMTSPTEYGGQGLPHTFGTIIDELCSSTNISLGMYSGLTHGSVVSLTKYASDDLKDRYLQKLITGEYTGTMCLTEAHAGTDLGLIKTKAVPVEGEENACIIDGSKIWISGGEQDLTDNIIHLVLAKLPDAPPGSKGISLFLVPKFLEDGTRNGAYCTGLEHKMGINGSATCFMSFEGAKGWLVGEPHKGLKYMFAMMNSARLMVGVQGLGLAETAYQTSLSFAKERQQSRSLTGAKQPDQPADCILVHPDVRRMLLTQKISLEGCRALAYWVGLQIDISEAHPDEAARAAADDMVQLFTPVVKAYLTDQGFECCDLAVQSMGGSGFTKDWGVEQVLRDIRISRIYEGTNAIQALDFTGRKLPLKGGQPIKAFLGEVAAFLKECSDEGTKTAIKASMAQLNEGLTWLMMEGMKDREQAGAAATPLLKLFALVSLGYFWARMGETAQKAIESGEGNTAFYQTKLKSRDFFMSQILPETAVLLNIIKAGKQDLMSFTEEEF